MEWILIAILVIALLAVAAYALKQRQSRQLREGFGPEYERTVQRTGDRREAESELRDRRERRDSFEVRELDPAAHERFGDRWLQTQRHFVDEPDAAVHEADTLVREVMHARGYPVDEDFERRAADVSVDHPEVVEHYRAAHEIARRDQTSTEDQRQAMVHYRALFGELLGSNHKEEART